VRERPHWAIVKACSDVRHGSAGINREFCPSEPTFNGIIGRLVQPYEDALRRTERLLAAKIAPPPAPKLTRAEIEARLGRRLDAPPAAEANPTPAANGNHVARTMADLAARKAEREQGCARPPTTPPPSGPLRGEIGSLPPLPPQVL
jgi:hypothetical protein